MIQQKANNQPTTIVAFDATYILVAIFRSINEASALTGIVRASIIKAAYGDIVSANNRYWRAVPPDFQIEPDDIGVLNLFDFDAAIGEDRKIYPTKKMRKHSAMFESEYIEMQTIKNKSIR